MIRWKAFIPVAVITAVVCVLYMFFIDTIIKNIIISSGQGIFNAKVEVQKVTLSLKNSSLRIQGLTIANEKEPFKNLLDIGAITMDIRTLPLFSKKFIIDEVSAEKVTWGTPRRVSGALPKKVKKGKKKKDKEDAKPSSIKLPLDILKGIGKKVDIKKMIDVDNLAAVKKARELEDQIKEKEQKWRQDAEKFNGYNDRIQAISDDIKAVKTIKKIQSLKDVNEAKNKIKKLQEAKNELKAMQQEIADAKNNLKKESDFLKKNIGQLDSIKKEDYKNIVDSMGFGSVSMGKIGNAMFGPVIMNKINTAVTWADKIREKMPKRKDKKQKKPERKRLKGRDILFPKKKGLPGFLVKKVSFSAQSPDAQEGKKLVLRGNIKNITSNPILLGKPIMFAGEGQFAGMKNSKIWIKGSMDYTTDIPQEDFSLKVKGYNLQGTSWQGGKYVPGGIGRGTATIDAQLKRVNETIQSTIKVIASNITFMRLEMDKEKDKAQEIMDEIFAGINAVNLKGTISGVPPGDLKVSLTSNLDDIVSKRLKEVFGKEIEKQKARVKEEVDKIVNAKKKELLGDLEGKKKELMDTLLGKEGIIKEKINLAQNGVKEKESVIKNYTKEKTKKSTDKIQKDLKNQFKKMFK